MRYFRLNHNKSPSITRTFSISPPAKPTTRARPPHTTHFSASTPSRKNKANGEDAPVLARGVHTFNATDRIVHDVNATPTRNLQNFFLPTIFRIINDKVRTAICACDIEFGGRCTSDHACADHWAYSEGQHGIEMYTRRTRKSRTPLPI
jgi:hypothetical protein